MKPVRILAASLLACLAGAAACPSLAAEPGLSLPAASPFTPPSAREPMPSPDAAPAPAPVTTPAPAKPAVGFALPPPLPATAGVRPPMLPPLPLPPNAQVPAPAVESASAAPAGKRSTFMSREEISANRARCRVELKGSNHIQLSARKAEQLVRLSGGQGCLTAVSTDVDWLDVRMTNEGVALVSSLNAGGQPRDGMVTVVTPNKTFELSVSQQGAQ